MIDPFAQTAGTDDLFFDDDFVPVAEPVVEQNPVETQPAEAPSQTQGGLAQSQHTPRGPSNGERGARGRGRGRGGRGRGRGGTANTETREKKDEKEKDTDKKEEPKDGEENEPAEEDKDQSTEPPSTPSTSKEPKESKPPTSVRGDRTLTGGPKRARLTEDELNAKMASMRAKNDALQAAHTRAETDAANFEAREALAAKQTAERRKQLVERQKEDRKNRQQMMGERERNRQRKLEASKGREWDFEKEEGFSGTGEERRRGAARGAHGGVTPSSRPAPATGDGNADNYGAESTPAGAEDAPSTPSFRDRGRGRGRGRGGRGSRGGRGDHAQTSTPHKKAEEQLPPTAADFPSLPQSSTPANQSTSPPKNLSFPLRTKTEAVKDSEPDRPGVKKQDSFGLPSPAGAGKSWADQVEKENS